MSIEDRKIKVVAQKAIPEAKIEKGFSGFYQRIIITLEDGREVGYNVSRSKKKDLVAKLAKLPVDNVTGMAVTLNDQGMVEWTTHELFAYNGI